MIFESGQNCDRTIVSDLTDCAIKIDSCRLGAQSENVVTFILHNYITNGKLTTLRRIAFQTFLDYQINSNKFVGGNSMDPQEGISISDNN